ncbi:MAG: hypothetical protein K1X92_16025, partial [Bacteroidia bacterium]|nr:hypothetical protein [Bacteroidia bacterium]
QIFYELFFAFLKVFSTTRFNPSKSLSKQIAKVDTFSLSSKFILHFFCFFLNNFTQEGYKFDNQKFNSI